MQQATVNLFADMGAQPATLQTGLVAGDAVDRLAAADLDDHLAGRRRHGRSRRSTSRSPARRADTAAASSAGVEVSIDGGATWHPRHRHGSPGATAGRPAARPVTIKQPRRRRQRQHRDARRRRHRAVTGAPARAHLDAGDARRSPSTRRSERRRARRQVPRRRRRLHHRHPLLQGRGNTGTHVGNLWTSAGTLLGHGHVHQRDRDRLAAGRFATPVAVTAEHDLRRLVLRARTATTRPTAQLLRHRRRRQRRRCTRSPTRRRRRQRRLQLRRGGGFPTRTTTPTNYWVDVVFDTVGAADTTPPTVTAGRRPRARPASPPARRSTATFSEAVTPRPSPRRSSCATRRRDRAGDRQPTTRRRSTATFTPTPPLRCGDRPTRRRSAERRQGRRRQRAWRRRSPGRSPPPAPPARARAPSGRLGDAGGAADDPTPASVELGVKFRADVGRLRSPASASTRARPTPAPTSATSGPRPARCSATATFTSETAIGLAAGHLRQPGRDHGQHDLRRLVPRPQRPLRGDAQLLRDAGVDNGAAARAGQRRRRRQRRLRLRRAGGFPTSTYDADQLLGRRRLQHQRRPDTTAADRGHQDPGGRARPGSRTATHSDRDLQRGDRAGNREHGDLRAAHARNALVPAAVTYDAATRTATLAPRRRGRRRLHGGRSAAARPTRDQGHGRQRAGRRRR